MNSQQLTKKQRRQLNRAKRLEQQLGGVVVWLVGQKPLLPPTTIAGHIEVSPPAHILTEPMDVRVFKHLLEHADGSGPPAVIITYNCQDFDCEEGLLDKLTQLVNEYPSYLYLAPFPHQTAKLVLTRLGQQEILDKWDEQKIRDFIEQK